MALQALLGLDATSRERVLATQAEVTDELQVDDSSIEIASSTLQVKADGIDNLMIDWGETGNQVNAGDIPGTFTGITATNVDSALEENRTEIDAIEDNGIASTDGSISTSGTIGADNLDVETVFSKTGTANRSIDAADLASTTNAEGASMVGIEDSAGKITATDVEGALAENRGLIDSLTTGLNYRSPAWGGVGLQGFVSGGNDFETQQVCFRLSAQPQVGDRIILYDGASETTGVAGSEFTTGGTISATMENIRIWIDGLSSYSASKKLESNIDPTNDVIFIAVDGIASLITTAYVKCDNGTPGSDWATAQPQVVQNAWGDADNLTACPNTGTPSSNFQVGEVGVDGYVYSIRHDGKGIIYKSAESEYTIVTPPGFGTITSVVAGTGMTGGGSSGAVTLNAIGGDGILANANDLEVDLATNPGLQFTSNKLDLKIEASKGLSKGASGIAGVPDNAKAIEVGASGFGITLEASNPSFQFASNELGLKIYASGGLQKDSNGTSIKIDADKGLLVDANGLAGLADTALGIELSAAGFGINIEASSPSLQVSSLELGIKFTAAGGLQKSASGTEIKLSGTTLQLAAGGISVKGLPSLFEINGTAVGASVTAGNLDELVGGADTTLHTHDLAYGATDVTATFTELNYLDGPTPGTAVASKALVLGATKNIDTIDIPLSGFKIGGTAMDCSATELNQLDGTTNIAEADTFFANTDITGAEAQTLTAGTTSNADALHEHARVADDTEVAGAGGVTIRRLVYVDPATGKMLHANGTATTTANVTGVALAAAAADAAVNLAYSGRVNLDLPGTHGAITRGDTLFLGQLAGGYVVGKSNIAFTAGYAILPLAVASVSVSVDTGGTIAAVLGAVGLLKTKA